MFKVGGGGGGGVSEVYQLIVLKKVVPLVVMIGRKGIADSASFNEKKVFVEQP